MIFDHHDGWESWLELPLPAQKSTKRRNQKQHQDGATMSVNDAPIQLDFKDAVNNTILYFKVF